MISIVFLLKKTPLVLVYNTENAAVEITVIDTDLYGEHRPEERITGSKTNLDFSAGCTYTRVYTVLSSLLFSLSSSMDLKKINPQIE